MSVCSCGDICFDVIWFKVSLTVRLLESQCNVWKIEKTATERELQKIKHTDYNSAKRGEDVMSDC